MSKESRMNAKKTREEYRAKSRRASTRKVLVPLIIIIVIALIVVWEVVHHMDRYAYPSADYKQGMTTEGLIEGFDYTTDVNLCDFTSIPVASKDVVATEDYIDEQIAKLVEDAKTLNEEEGVIVKEGDNVKIYYTVYEGEEEMLQVNKEADLVMGEDKIIAGFDANLIGQKVKDHVKFNMSFPEDYKDAEVAGKDVLIDVKISGIYDIPEFTDEYVAENYADVAKTVEEYRAYVAKNFYDSNINTAIQNYIVDNSSVVNYPEVYLDGVAKNTLFQYNYYFASAKSYGMTKAANMFAYYDKTRDELIADCKEEAKTEVARNMYLQAIAQSLGITVSEDELKASVLAAGVTEENYDQTLSSYGRGYWMQQAMFTKTFEALGENVVVK